MMTLGKESGFTLLEIMVVLLLLSMLMGIGVGAFSKVGGGPTLARSQLKEAIGTARRQALRERAPAVVLVDAAQGTVKGVGWKRVGCWHFEEMRAGSSPGFPVDAAMGTASIAPGGVIGNCLDLGDGASAGVAIPAFPSLNSVEGIALDLFVRLDSPGPRRFIGKGDFYFLGTDDDGNLCGGLKLVPAGAAKPGPPEQYQITAESCVLPSGRWVRAALHFNGYTCFLSAGGIVVAEETFSAPVRLVTDEATPIRIGNRTDPFLGRVDEVRVGAAVTGEEMRLPDTVRIAEGPRRIYFDRDGRLDRNFHTLPVKIVLEYGEGRQSVLRVALSGEVR